MTEPRSQLNRRRAIALVGGGFVLASVGLAGCSTSYPAATLKAWDAVPEDTDPRRFMLAHALLAPNPHNRQPWRADLRRDSEITLLCDKDRLLPETDPWGRQILIGCGAFIELAVIAAAQRGFRVQIEAFPDGEPAAQELPGGRAVARLLLQADPAAPRDPSFVQIRRRYTHKGAYDNARQLAPQLWSQLTSSARQFGLLAGAIVEPAQLEQVRAIARASFETEMTTSRTWLESAHLLRIGPSEIERHRDGISVMGLLPRVAAGLGMFDRFEVPVRGSSNFARVMERWQPQETGSGYLWIATRGNSRRAQVDTGRAFVRAQLQATALGVHMHPASQALQEFAEMRPHYEAVHRLLGFEPAQTTLQMLARVGHGVAAAGPSPRRDLNQIVTA